ncbi:DUF695 domain-containing protein [Acidicapsa dinghuensis]|uniref:DUF695 domain-containing protein n=1 Tax=Acidicapsa dinghuensis TaxID=2218256 RepID=A0ABW1EI87_9BACT|nr:DUF695 domain-containing protein [Acidicapsa dinghuensis]
MKKYCGVEDEEIVADQWNFYFCTVNDLLASIFLNLGLRDQVPIAAKPWLLWVWVYFLSPREDGLSSSEESPVLSKIEDLLSPELTEACGAILSGRITTAGRREFYFYGESSNRFESTVRKCLAVFPEYKFDLQADPDPEWKQYLDVLYPNLRQFESMANRDVLDALERNGDRHELEREVDYFLYFSSDTGRSLFCDAAEKLGYRVELLGKSEGERPFGVQLHRFQSVDQNTIDSIVFELMTLGEKYGGDYDGWGTEATAE